MLGDDWGLWQSLFVPTVPARSRILERDITSVVTGPRGCGKTMLFRRLSERLMVECGPVDEIASHSLGFMSMPTISQTPFRSFLTRRVKMRLRISFALSHLCILSDFLAVEAAQAHRGLSAFARGDRTSGGLAWSTHACCTSYCGREPTSTLSGTSGADQELIY